MSVIAARHTSVSIPYWDKVRNDVIVQFAVLWVSIPYWDKVRYHDGDCTIEI